MDVNNGASNTKLYFSFERDFANLARVAMRRWEGGINDQSYLLKVMSVGDSWKPASNREFIFEQVLGNGNALMRILPMAPYDPCPSDPCDVYCAGIGFGGNAFYQICLNQCIADCTASVPTCSDGIQNQGETATDCGGPCPPCPDCVVDGQCPPGEHCVNGNCEDGEIGSPCLDNSDCDSQGSQILLCQMATNTCCQFAGLGGPCP